MRLAVAVTGIALACAGCNLVPGSGANEGTAQATVTYQDDSGVHTSEVSVGAITCDVTRGNGAFITAGEGSGQLVNATVSEGDSLVLTIALGHDELVFYSMDPFDITDDGAEFTDLPGGVTQAIGEAGIIVDPAATATGSITCP